MTVLEKLFKQKTSAPLANIVDIQQRFSRFLHLLEMNNEALGIISDMDEKSKGEIRV